jgi:hypothetical protein
MFAQLNPPSQRNVWRRLSLRFDTPCSPATQRRQELHKLAELLATTQAPPGWSFRHINRKEYDKARTTEAPSSVTLVNRYGTWVNACRHADRLVADRANTLVKHRRAALSTAPRKYTRPAIVAALRECAAELHRVPSSHAYQAWRIPAERRRPGAFYPTATVIFRHYADRGGWIAALEDADLVTPPHNTVRIVTQSAQDAGQLAETLRDDGHIAAHAGSHRWVEMLGSSQAAKLALIRISPWSGTAYAIWDPIKRQLLVLVGPTDRLAT